METAISRRAIKVTSLGILLAACFIGLMSSVFWLPTCWRYHRLKSGPPARGQNFRFSANYFLYVDGGDSSGGGVFPFEIITDPKRLVLPISQEQIQRALATAEWIVPEGVELVSRCLSLKPAHRKIGLYTRRRMTLGGRVYVTEDDVAPGLDLVASCVARITSSCQEGIYEIALSLPALSAFADGNNAILETSQYGLGLGTVLRIEMGLDARVGQFKLDKLGRRLRPDEVILAEFYAQPLE
ncbi:MAG TPA: hypothetical protein PLO37_01885 [Candidatus Hydrogenedentes bacterium]|nr:hypothetical protein [Candidatus Hydrogenedentota bacterium]HPG65567.1 hypothetical protein [Candidatus Hydrogenedentota bacterium]